MQKTCTVIDPQTTGLQQVAHAVKTGLSLPEKKLPSWLFYDEQGDKIFQAIMEMPEYYPTNCEHGIFTEKKKEILRDLVLPGVPFRLAELGAGDGMKTEVLLRYFVQEAVPFSYCPIDISESVLQQLQQRLKNSLPQLDVQPVCGQYEAGVKQLQLQQHQRTVYLFLGANIGNFPFQEAVRFVGNISNGMQSSDLLMVGFDLKKDPRMIQAAYDDAQGITSDFNLNLLTRLNRELGANFRLDQFKHHPYYNPQTGEAKSYLVSTVDQQVYIAALEQTFTFRQWECIDTEISLKFDMNMIETLAAENGLEIAATYYDSKQYFCDVLFRKTVNAVK